jgi:uncharacterized protein YggU (UPF0235/DUF167 family)
MSERPDSPGTYVTVVVKPGSRAPGVEADGDRLIVRVRERAVEGAATAACLRAVAAYFGVAPSRVRLVRGARSREKLLRIER